MNIIKFELQERDITIFHRKKGLEGGYKVIDPQTHGELIDVRFYTTKNRYYCVVWVRAKEWGVGGSFLGFDQYGINFQSTLLFRALRSAGIEFSERWEGTGVRPMREALKSIAQYMGVENPILVEFFA